MNQQPPHTLKPKQTDILYLLYKFRFLNRIQIQTLLKHKYYSRITTWLNDLTKHKYINCEFNRTIGNKPSVYCLGTAGRKELLGKENIKNHLLERVYQEKKASPQFKIRAMMIVDIYISLLDLTQENKAKLTFLTETDMTGMKYLPLPHPHAFFSIEQEKVKKRYFLEVFDEQTSTKWLYKRVQQFFHYYEEHYWQDHNKNPFPEILFVYCDLDTKKELEKFIKRKLDEFENISFSLTSWEQIKLNGLRKDILYKIL